MSKQPAPLTDDDGDVRELSAEDLKWFVRSADFAGPDEMHAFLLRREEIFRAADELGLSRETFLDLEPNKPGFEDRVRDAFWAIARAAGLAAE